MTHSLERGHIIRAEIAQPVEFYLAGCDRALYLSSHKFRSGHGWPAFCDNLPDALVRHGSRKVEITCAGCDGHIGHVFKSSRYPLPRAQPHAPARAPARYATRLLTFARLGVRRPGAPLRQQRVTALRAGVG